MALVVDTSVFITLERQRRSWQEALAGESSAETLAIATITASELLAGVYRADTAERAFRRSAYAEEILRSMEILPFDLEAARIHSRLWSELESLGQAIGRYDLLIAATALATGSAVLTDNIREFSRISGLEVRQPLL